MCFFYLHHKGGSSSGVSASDHCCALDVSTSVVEHEKEKVVMLMELSCVIGSGGREELRSFTLSSERQ